jgi:hypothetical protein
VEQVPVILPTPIRISKRIRRQDRNRTRVIERLVHKETIIDGAVTTVIASAMEAIADARIKARTQTGASRVCLVLIALSRDIACAAVKVAVSVIATTTIRVTRLGVFTIESHSLETFTVLEVFRNELDMFLCVQALDWTSIVCLFRIWFTGRVKLAVLVKRNDLLDDLILKHIYQLI